MFVWLRRSLAGLCLVGLLAGPATAAEKAPPGKGETPKCEGFGTSVEFVSTPSVAAKWAKKEQKLVFVLHVSGNFEDPRFT